MDNIAKFLADINVSNLAAWEAGWISWILYNITFSLFLMLCWIVLSWLWRPANLILAMQRRNDAQTDYLKAHAALINAQVERLPPLPQEESH